MRIKYLEAVFGCTMFGLRYTTLESNRKSKIKKS